MSNRQQDINIGKGKDLAPDVLASGHWWPTSGCVANVPSGRQVQPSVDRCQAKEIPIISKSFYEI